MDRYHEGRQGPRTVAVIGSPHGGKLWLNTRMAAASRIVPADWSHKRANGTASWQATTAMGGVKCVCVCLMPDMTPAVRALPVSPDSTNLFTLARRLHSITALLPVCTLRTCARRSRA